MDEEMTRMATAGIIIAVVVVAGLSLLYLFTPAFEQPPTGDNSTSESERPYLMKITVVSNNVDPIPHSSNFFKVNITVEDPIEIDGTWFGPMIEQFFIYQDDVDGYQFDGISSLQYSMHSLAFMGAGAMNLKVTIFDTAYPWELVLWEVDSAAWKSSPTDGTYDIGPLFGEDCWGDYWQHHVAFCTGLPYDVYIDLGPRGL
jgi:hypothetical protein